MEKSARDAKKTKHATDHMVRRYRAAAEKEDSINRRLQEIREEVDGLPSPEMDGIVGHVQEEDVDSFEDLDKRMEQIMVNQGKKMNSLQKERFALIVESQVDHINNKPSPIMSSGARIILKFLKGEVIDYSRPRVRIKWEDGTGDWVHGATAHKYYSR